MKQEKTKSRMPQIGEAVFCIAYLVFDLIAAIVFLSKAGGSQILNLFGVLTLVLGGGDAFHLLPRTIKAFRGDLPKVEWWAGLGLMVSSITMTVFYVLLFYVWKTIFPQVTYPNFLPVLIWVSAVLRIVLCLIGRV